MPSGSNVSHMEVEMCADGGNSCRIFNQTRKPYCVFQIIARRVYSPGSSPYSSTLFTTFHPTGSVLQ